MLGPRRRLQRCGPGRCVLLAVRAELFRGSPDACNHLGSPTKDELSHATATVRAETRIGEFDARVGANPAESLLRTHPATSLLCALKAVEVESLTFMPDLGLSRLRWL